MGINDYYDGDGEWAFPLGAMQMLGRSDAFTNVTRRARRGRPRRSRGPLARLWLTTEDLPQWRNQVRLTKEGGNGLTYHPSNLDAQPD